MHDDEEIYDFRAAWEAVRRRAWLVVGLGVLVAAAAGIATAAQAERYEATAVLLFRDPGLDPQIVGRPNLLGGEQIFDGDTNVGLASLDAVSDRVGEQGSTGLAAAEVADAVTVSEGAGPELVEITAEDEDPVRAALIANSYAQAFVELRRDVDRATVRGALEAAAAKLQGLPPESADGPEAIQLREQIGELSALELLQTGDAEVVAIAEPPTASSSGSALQNAAIGGLAGLILGLAAALLWERLDPRLRTARDFSSVLGAPVLATIPPVETDGPGTAGKEGEAFRGLAVGLRYREPGRHPRSVLVLPSRRGSGASTVALNLARVSAEDGASVAVADADLNDPQLTGLAAAAGLTVDSELSESLGGALRGESPLPEVLDHLSKDHDLVVIDAPPLVDATDAIPLLGLVDAIVVVCRAGESRSSVEEMRRRLEGFGASAFGVVINRAE